MVEGSGLENRRALIAYRGFESHPLRHLSKHFHTKPSIKLTKKLFFLLSELKQSKSFQNRELVGIELIY